MMWWAYVLISVVLTSIAAITRKKALEHEHALEYSSFRSTITFLILLAILPFVFRKVDVVDMLLIFLISISSSWGIVVRNRAVRHGNISEISSLDGFRTVFVLLLAFIFLAELPSVLNMVGIIVIVLGVYVLEFDHASGYAPFTRLKSNRSARLYLFSLLLFSVGAVMMRFVLQRVHPLTATVYLWLGICVWIIVFELMMHGLQDVKHIKTGWYWVVVTAILLIGMNFLSNVALSLPDGKAALVTALMATTSVVVVIFGGRIFHEQKLLHHTIAAVIILIGSGLLIL